MTAATISGWKFRLGDNASPEVFNAIDEVVSVTGVGAQGEDLDVTNFDSATGYKEFISGLKEGSEVVVEANYLPAATQQLAMMTAVEAGINRNFQLAYTTSSPERTFTFAGSPKGYTINPSATEANRITFTIKISGAITRA